jgi:hypothetical protein
VLDRGAACFCADVGDTNTAISTNIMKWLCFVFIVL